MMKFDKTLFCRTFLAANLIMLSVGAPASSAVVHRDKYGIPHIQTMVQPTVNNIKDLFRAYGKTVAQDRLFQVEMIRRQFEGKTAEVLGEKFLNNDKLALNHINMPDLERQIQELPEAQRAILQGYVEGFNEQVSHLLKHPQDIPKEFAKYDFLPSYWREVDVAAIFAGIFNGFGDFNTELFNLDLYNSLVKVHGQDNANLIFSKLFWKNDPDAYATAHEDGPDVRHMFSASDAAVKKQEVMGLEFASLSPDLLKKAVADSKPDAPFARSMSNAWLVGAQKAKNARAIFVNGPQPGWFNPSYFNEVELVGAGYNVIGMSFFGLPVIILGMNDKVGWGITSANTDQVDNFLLKIRLRNNELEYYSVSGKKWVPAVPETHILRIKDERAENYTVWRTGKGTLFDIDIKKGEAFERRRAWEGHEVSSMMSWARANRATNYPDWKNAINDIAYGLNFYYVDTDGKIGYQLAGLFPIRAKGQDFRLPVINASDVDMSWQGMLPAEQNAHVTATTRGSIVNWNNKPSPNWPNPDKFWSQWTSIDRVDAITRAIHQLPSLTPTNMWLVVRTTSFADLNVHGFLPFIEKAASPGNTTSIKAVMMAKELRKWASEGGQRVRFVKGKAIGLPGEAIMNTWLKIFLEKTLKPVLPFKRGRAYLSTSRPKKPPMDGDQVKAGPRVIYRELKALANNPQDSQNLLYGRDVSDLIVQSLESTYDILADEFGTDISTWRLPIIKQEYYGESWMGVPLAGRSLYSPVYMNRGGANMMIVATPDGRLEGYSIAPPGQNGDCAKQHHSDQLERYQAFICKKMTRMFDHDKANM